MQLTPAEVKEFQGMDAASKVLPFVKTAKRRFVK